MKDEITKVEYFRDHAEFLRAVAGCVRENDKTRTRLLDMAFYFEDLAESADRDTRLASSPMRRPSRTRRASHHRVLHLRRLET